MCASALMSKAFTTENIEVHRENKSEFSGVLGGPALYHYFLFGIELYRVASLAVLHAEEAVFPAAKREIGHGSSHADIDPNIPRRGFIAEAAGRGATCGKERSLISVGAALEKC